MTGRVLVAGFSTRHVAQSAAAAGYDVVSVDHFCDRDLSLYTSDRISFSDVDEIPDCIAEMARRHRVDWLVTTSGAETLHTPIPLLGNGPGIAARFLDKARVQEFFESAGIPVPSRVPEGMFPAMVKPLSASGGWRNRVVCSEKDLAAWRDEYPGMDHLLQQVVEGTPASVSCLCNGKGAVALACNAQILRGEDPAPWGFAGSLTPFSHPLSGHMAAFAARAAAASGCVGSVGIDFVLEKDAWAIELNPRFQATVDTVERALGVNLFRLHVDACRGILPARPFRPRQHVLRQILFAPRTLVVREDLMGLLPRVADIPWPGTRIAEGDALISVFGWGPTPAHAEAMRDDTINRVHRAIGYHAGGGSTG
ncbi:MAG: ATP-grasp domain-containing protein [Methanomicrobiales archaeon]|nr:ATP-grasp domain-containing protein [Methanomicrobiales archaeon]